RAAEGAPTGENQVLSASFDKQGEGPPGVATGTLSHYHGEKKVGEATSKTQPGKFVIGGEGLCVGRDSGAGVTDDYPGTMPWNFTGGTIKRVAVDVSGDPYVDLEREAAAMLMRERRRRSEEHTSELQSRRDLVCRLLLEKKNSARQEFGWTRCLRARAR